MTAIKPKAAKGFVPTAQSVFSKVRGVNKTDALTLLNQLGPLSKVAQASVAQLLACPGLADKKVARLREAFHEPFSASVDGSRLASNAKRRRLGMPSIQEWRNAAAACCSVGLYAIGTGSSDHNATVGPAALAAEPEQVQPQAAEVLDVAGMLELVNETTEPSPRHASAEGEAESATVLSISSGTDSE
jgi:hypothetical protein